MPKHSNKIIGQAYIIFRQLINGLEDLD